MLRAQKDDSELKTSKLSNMPFRLWCLKVKNWPDNAKCFGFFAKNAVLQFFFIPLEIAIDARVGIGSRDIAVAPSYDVRGAVAII